MVLAIAREFALINGHSAQEVSKYDWEQARREMLGQPEIHARTAAFESTPESEQWDLLPGLTLRKVLVPAGEDKDDRRNGNEQLIAADIAAAEYDQLLQAQQSRRARDMANPELF
jgi:hypothetical protein